MVDLQGPVRTVAPAGSRPASLPADSTIRHLCRLRGRRRLRGWRQGVADRGAVGISARGGLDGKDFAGRQRFMPDGKDGEHLAGRRLPCERNGARRRSGPAGSAELPANGYGLFDMIGNVWEVDDRLVHADPGPPRPCCGGRAGEELRPVPARDPHPAPGGEGRIVPVRAQLCVRTDRRRAIRRWSTPAPSYRLPLHSARYQAETAD